MAVNGLSSSGKKRKGTKETFEGAVETWKQRKTSQKKPRIIPTSPIKNGDKRFPILPQHSLFVYFSALKIDANKKTRYVVFDIKHFIAAIKASST